MVGNDEYADGPTKAVGPCPTRVSSFPLVVVIDVVPGTTKRGPLWPWPLVPFCRWPSCQWSWPWGAPSQSLMGDAAIRIVDSSLTYVFKLAWPKFAWDTVAPRWDDGSVWSTLRQRRRPHAKQREAILCPRTQRTIVGPMENCSTHGFHAFSRLAVVTVLLSSFHFRMVGRELAKSSSLLSSHDDDYNERLGRR